MDVQRMLDEQRTDGRSAGKQFLRRIFWSGGIKRRCLTSARLLNIFLGTTQLYRCYSCLINLVHIRAHLVRLYHFAAHYIVVKVDSQFVCFTRSMHAHNKSETLIWWRKFVRKFIPWAPTSPIWNHKTERIYCKLREIMRKLSYKIVLVVWTLDRL